MKTFNPQGQHKMWFPSSKATIHKNIAGWLKDTNSTYSVEEVMKSARLVEEPEILGQIWEIPCEHLYRE